METWKKWMLASLVLIPIGPFIFGHWIYKHRCRENVEYRPRQVYYLPMMWPFAVLNPGSRVAFWFAIIFSYLLTVFGILVYSYQRKRAGESA
jgi:hypothetical protein